MTDEEIIQQFLAGELPGIRADWAAIAAVVRCRLHELTAYKAHHLANVAKRRRQWRANHPTANAEAVAEWRQQHPEKVREYQRISQARRKAKKAAATH